MTAAELKTAREIRWLKKCFRSLAKWKVAFASRKMGARTVHGERFACCSWSTHPVKSGNIARYGPGRVPCDYAFHEMLHLAFAEFRTIRGGNRRRAFEEMLIQDICKVHRQARSHK